uniref:Uncharacterized protein n=1 Tax=Ditylenchus dipsaci TaxID=166011 RepID=A0A915D673_9BILA
MMENKAKALLKFVQEISEPNPADKRSALSSVWSLATVKKSLNLQSDMAFSIVLARADSMKRDFAEFVFQTARRVR